MSTLMLAGTSGFDLSAIKSWIGDEFDAELRDVVGGARLTVRSKSGDYVVELNAFDSEDNADTMADLLACGSDMPSEFRNLLEEKTIWFLLMTANDSQADGVNAIVNTLWRQGVAQFDSSDKIRELDGSPVI